MGVSASEAGQHVIVGGIATARMGRVKGGASCDAGLKQATDEKKGGVALAESKVVLGFEEKRLRNSRDACINGASFSLLTG